MTTYNDAFEAMIIAQTNWNAHDRAVKRLGFHPTTETTFSITARKYETVCNDYIESWVRSFQDGCITGRQLAAQIAPFGATVE